MQVGAGTVFVGVGSNLGDRQGAIAEAALGLVRGGFGLLRTSSLFETEPVGCVSQGWFLNGVFGGDTTLSPEELVTLCLDVERSMGRERSFANAPRVIDLDVLLFGEETRSTPQVAIPHPRLHLRRFVLAPLCEIAPFAHHPTLGVTVAELLERCTDASIVRLAARPGDPA